ncbi:MAG: glycosyltransferase [Chloroflexi bacterium]|nr:glycosyltransferase [Chloroflexota bacterium]
MPDVPRVAFLTSHPIQYQAPLFRALAADGRIVPHVVFLSRHGLTARHDAGFGATFAWDVDLLSGYRSTFVRNLREHAPPGRPGSYVNPSLVRQLEQIAPAAIVFFGVRNPSALGALAWARVRGIRCLYRAESSILERRRAATRLLARAVLDRMDALLPIGTANDLYYDLLGVPERARHLAPYTVDNAFFTARDVGRDTARAALNLPADDFVVLFAGKLVPWKDPELVVHACANVAATMPVRALFAGDGPMRRKVEQTATAQRVRATVLGFLNQSELATAYAAADVFVLPSLAEPWGLVVNEAMCFNLPVLASTRVGAHLDLVRRGENGEVFAAGDAGALAGALRRLAEDPDRRRRFGARSRELIDRWDLAATVDGVVAGVLGDA